MINNKIFENIDVNCQHFLKVSMLSKPIIAGEILFEENSPIHDIIFPIAGIISMQLTDHDGQTVESFFVGRDGLLGAHSLLGLSRQPCTGKVVISGRAWWLPLTVLREAQEEYSSLVPIITGSLNGLLQQLVRNVLCANCHSAIQRIATWLLHVQDRADSDTYDLTQHTMSEIFGLRAATISSACNFMMSIGAVQYSRGQFRIRNRRLLIEQACGCYEMINLGEQTPSKPLKKWAA